MIKMNNLLLVAGTNRNVGKTTFCCKAIQQLKNTHQVWAIKITPHIHKNCNSCKILFQDEQLIISEELSRNQLKDSTRMLDVGAEKVIFIQGADEKMSKVAIWIKNNIPSHLPIVCESASLRNFIEPGLFVMMSTSAGIAKHSSLISLANIHIIDYQYNLSDLDFQQNKWHGSMV